MIMMTMRMLRIIKLRKRRKGNLKISTSDPVQRVVREGLVVSAERSIAGRRRGYKIQFKKKEKKKSRGNTTSILQNQK